ncbi:D-alanyl-D-alanine carboxypeptidase family protein [Nonomuraea africana]|uniref:Prefoldin subunit 5 n=1 Tax=Nonomuraea africana TaxID=46171 RepID=A0ABR9KNH2_9ACTN|nr:D-alanyl-D-alanine carboxypeptidase family protein [Nonomuraea africana]MBE1563569.1 prefoldin subunit 5 [Nonomuraea africana]
MSVSAKELVRAVRRAASPVDDVADAVDPGAAVDELVGTVETPAEGNGAAGAVVPDPGGLSALRKEAEKAANELAAAQKVLDKRTSDLKASNDALTRKLKDLAAAETALARMRRPIADLVELVYQQPVGDGVFSYLTGDVNEEMLRAQSDASALAQARQLQMDAIAKVYADKQRLAAEAQELRATNLLAAAQVEVEVSTLTKRSEKVVQSLTKALVKLGIKIDRVGRAAFACNPLRIDATKDYPNGLIPKNILCPIQQRGHLLRADAAIAFVSLNEAYTRQFGQPMCVTDAYRTLAEQQSVYYRRPGFAAVPGRSNHGLGMAVDLCGGVQTAGTPQFRWLEANSKKYGWFHPDWAYSNPYEPWHWEYDPEIDSLR